MRIPSSVSPPEPPVTSSPPPCGKHPAETLWLDCLSADRERLAAALRACRQGKDKARERYERVLLASRTARAARLAALPSPSFPAALPVNDKRAEIAALLRQHQTLIVCGETGSGKTTQLPKICLAEGRGAGGFIGHTQPRRLAARSVAARLAHELETSVGAGVGVKVRFQDKTSPESWVKLMTDGILLAETQSDPLLLAYDTIIIDEAHERGLNIDFLLGYLKEILPRRPDLKLILTSATIDAERFSEHFHGAPVIEVSGRVYPVEVRYRPVEETRPSDAPLALSERAPASGSALHDAIVDACGELARLGEGDILVFLPGEREIHEAAEILRRHHPAHTEILPLYARLSAEEQDRAFRPHGGRRIVLATNVAETSLTVPGIRYVVDTGLARLKRYSHRNRIEQLRVEKISQAAARQRSGRCGRVAAGVCIRLYEEKEFSARAPYTDPEILRSSLAGVLLRMKALGLSEAERFPFLDRPSDKAIHDGRKVLMELGALDNALRLTEIGKTLARLPLDPKLSRMLVAARERGCLKEALVLAAALSAQDPRERPPERQEAADNAHLRIFFPAGINAEKSEFLGWLRLWEWFTAAIAHKKSNKKLEEHCRANFFSWRRLKEWREIHAQLRAMTAEMGWRENETPAEYAALHKALLTGLVGNFGQQTEEGGGMYLGARGLRFFVHPSSFLQKKAGGWIMAAEIAETTRPYARCVARIEPEWLEEIAPHLLHKTYLDPHWEKKAMQVIAWEQVTLYGVIIAAKRRAHYGPLDPDSGRKIFIRQALVGGEVDERYARQWAFWRHNRALIADIERLEHKQRRQDVLVEDELIAAFYESRIPEGIYNGAAFDHWRREAEQTQPELLFLRREDLMRHAACEVTTDNFPPELVLSGTRYALSYHFEPGSERDGVTLDVPLPRLNQLPEPPLSWLIPGLLREKVIQLLKTLPQKIRARLVPLPECAEAFIAWSGENATRKEPGLLPALLEFIRAERGITARGWEITEDAFRPDALPLYLSMNLALLDEHGRRLDMGRSLAQLKSRWGEKARESFSAARENLPPDSSAPTEYARLTDWTFGALPELLEIQRDGETLIGYPALRDQGDSVRIEVFDTPETARAISEAGLLRLFLLRFRDREKPLVRQIPDFSRMAMRYMALGSAEELRLQILRLIFTRACLAEPQPRDAESFTARCDEARPRLGPIAQEIGRLAGGILEDRQTLQKKILAVKAHPAAFADMEAQIARLVYGKVFLTETPFERLVHFPRYLKAIGMRIDKLKNDPARDARLLGEYQPLWAQYERYRQRFSRQRQGAAHPELEQARWLLEELRVGLFAQELKTPAPVSVKRLQKILDNLNAA
ncbi:MAG: ATP-dependent RNA helicase HrpA [Zoogloeaceae bacterium]|jgi:ATP-dependent helicase HrpA|nr:ATP-dependent RNA helicase HrpA [Zoogloeaceae bacterium]